MQKERVKRVVEGREKVKWSSLRGRISKGCNKKTIEGRDIKRKGMQGVGYDDLKATERRERET